MNYTRATIFVDGGLFTPEAIEEELTRIQTVLNGGLEASNFAPGEFAGPTVVNAGDDRFQTGGLDRAERIAAAIAEAAATVGPKVVFVPQTMFGYAEDAGWNASIFSTDVLMVREGGGSGHDPVAYGAKPDDAAVDDAPVFDVCFTQAAASAIGANPGMALVSVTLPGEYQLNTDVTIPASADIGYYRRAKCTLATSAVVQDDPAQDFLGEVSEEGLATLVRTAESAVTNVPGSSGTTIGLAVTSAALAEGTPLQFWFRVQEDGGGYGNPIHIANGYTVGNFTITWQLMEDTGAGVSCTFAVTNNDAGAHDCQIELNVRVLKDTPLGT